MNSQEPKIKFTEESGVVVVSFEGSSIGSLSEIEEISSAMKAYVDENSPKKIVVDFSDIKFFSSQTLGMLINVWKEIEGYKGRMVISGINPQLSRVFRITNLDKIFEFYPDRKAAIEGIQS